MDRRAAALFGFGTALFIAAFALYRHRAANTVERPAGSGDVGVMLVYAQRPMGPVQLEPGKLRAFPRPQHLSFQWRVNGEGPRKLRISWEGKIERKVQVVHEEDLPSPTEYYPLAFVLELDDRAPDELELIVEVEAPHTRGYELRFPLRLEGTGKDLLVRTGSASP